MATGDIRNNISKLQSELRGMHYSGLFDVEGLANGSPQSLLPLLHFGVAQSGLFVSVSGKSDARFVETLFLVLRDVFAYKPALKKEQLLARKGFAERKILMAIDVLRLMKGYSQDHLPQRDKIADAAQDDPEPVDNAEDTPNGHRIHTTAVLQPKHAFDPAKYASFSILDEFNAEYSQQEDLPQSNPSLPKMSLQTQFKLFESMPHQSLNMDKPLQAHPIHFGSSMQREYGVKEEKWAHFADTMHSGVILDPEFSFHTDSPSMVLPSINNADVSQSILHEPQTPPNPSMHPSILHAKNLQDNHHHQHKPIQRNRLSILKHHNTNDISKDRVEPQPPLNLADLNEQSSAMKRIARNQLQQQQVHIQDASKDSDSCDIDDAASEEDQRVGFLASTSATSGSRSLNLGHGGVGSGAGSSDAAALTAVPTTTRMEAARNRWNSAGLVMPAGYKGSNSHGSSAAVGSSMKSGKDAGVGSSFVAGLGTGVGNSGDRVLEWSVGSRDFFKNKDTTREVGVHESNSHARNESPSSARLESLVTNLMGVVAKLLENQESIKEDLSILNERLARVESAATIAQNDLKSSVVGDSVLDESRHRNSLTESTTTRPLPHSNTVSSTSRKPRPPSQLWLESKPPPTRPLQYADLNGECQTNQTQQPLEQLREEPAPEARTDREPLPTLPATETIGIPLMELPSNGASSIRFGKGAFAVSARERPTGEYIRSVEERLKATAEILRKAKLGQSSGLDAIADRVGAKLK
ncbi:Centrosomal protein of 44 kDa [Chytriomyces hyalinus]|nr:Centrosomal protein of 44 kDa [Chytriomyces hyalinus]